MSGASPIKAFALCALYVTTSAALINFNKMLMHRFPYALVLTSCHTFTCSLSTILLYGCKPSLFPSMPAVKERFWELPKYFVLLGLLFSVALYTSNHAYLYSSVSFLQFMKEANVVIVFAISCVIGLQSPTRHRIFVVGWILVGSSMCVHGEINFVLAGFIYQIVSQFCECGKNVLGEYLLSGNSIKLDALTYVLLMAPVTFSFLIAGVAFTWDPVIPHAIMQHWHLILPNSLLAFALNVAIALVLKECSAMGFIIAGVVKDILIVVASCLILGDPVTAFQVLGFVVALTGCATWSLLKVAPDSSYVCALKSMLRVQDDSEKLPLVTK